MPVVQRWFCSVKSFKWCGLILAILGMKCMRLLLEQGARLAWCECIDIVFG